VAHPGYWRLANWHERSAAAFGIEARHPFLDRRLFEYVLAIPGKQLFRLPHYKNLLRRAMLGILPEKIRLRQEKTKFTTFTDFMLREQAADEIRELLRDPLSAESGILDGNGLRTAYLAFLDGGTHDERCALWRAIKLEIWLGRYFAVLRNRRHSTLKAS
jgi:asparagine synthase (glutamine-hydrolysing)